MKVYAEFIKEDEKVYRKKTLLHFGDSTDLIGSAILINPGQSTPIIEKNLNNDFVKKFYVENHNINEKIENWHLASIDSTMGQLKKIFDGWYIGQNKELNGVIQLFNCFYYKDQNLEKALSNFSKDSKFVFNEHELLKNKPVYFGWGIVGKDGLLNVIAKQIFETYDHTVTPIYEKEFEKNCFYHPGYINRSYSRNLKTQKLTRDFFNLF